MTVKPVYSSARDVEIIAEEIVNTLRWGHIDLSRVKFVRSKGSKARAVARIWGLPRIFQETFGFQPSYVIEVLSENYDKLPLEEKEKTIIHELLHIPKTFSGALVSHRQFGKPTVNGRIVNKYWRQYHKLSGANGVNPPS